jgi:four helix bundle protein
MAEYKGYTGNTTQTFQKLHGFKGLLAWQAADELSVLVHRTVTRFSLTYSKLTNQMLGSASSVKANIAEGYCRNALGDYIRFCEIARGSLGELGSQLQDCERWGLVNTEDLKPIIRVFGDTSFFLEQLIKGLRQKRKDGDWDRSLGVREEQAPYHVNTYFTPFILDDGDGDQ